MGTNGKARRPPSWRDHANISPDILIGSMQVPDPGTLKVSKAPEQSSLLPTFSLQPFSVEENGGGKGERKSGGKRRGFATALDVRGNDQHVSSKGGQGETGMNRSDIEGVGEDVYLRLR
jgi:hypothetical protein